MKPNELRSGETVEPQQPSSPEDAGETGSSAENATQEEKATDSAHFKIPPLLLEGDEPAPQSVATPERKFTLGPVPAPARKEVPPAELPQTYGTGQLYLVARDPHSLYAHWDLSEEQQQHFLALSKDAHLTLKIRQEGVTQNPVSELPLPPGADHSFVSVEHTGTNYLAELGFNDRQGEWKRIAESQPALTPPDKIAEDKTQEFATVLPLNLSSPPTEVTPSDVALPLLPGSSSEHAASSSKSPGAPAPVRAALPEALLKGLSLPGATLFEQVQEAARAETAATIANVQSLGKPTGGVTRHGLSPKTKAEWSAQHERALADLLNWSPELRQAPSSAEIAELMLGQRELPLGELGLQVSSPSGGGLPARKGFWLNVNAELIVYGATEPDARVTIAGRQVPLRPDGTFSVRFALPDGTYQLPVTAYYESGELRQAEFKFHRATEFFGEVGLQTQDPALTPPG